MEFMENSHVKIDTGRQQAQCFIGLATENQKETTINTRRKAVLVACVSTYNGI